MTPLVLFDVDGTLVWGASLVHAGAFAEALAERYGAADPFVQEGDVVTCGGRTLGGRLDAEIARWCLSAAGVAEDRHDGELGGYCEGIVARYLATVAHAGTGAYVLPGVAETLEGLRSAGAPCGVVTGNLEPIARRKLEAVGLLRFFVRGGQLVGGFGTPPARSRSELFAHAEVRARQAGAVFSGVVYVGDTPLDAAAALERGVRFVGVATGRHSRHELGAAGAGPVLDTLADPVALPTLLGK